MSRRGRKLSEKEIKKLINDLPNSESFSEPVSDFLIQVKVILCFLV